MEQEDYSRFLDLFEQLIKAHKKDLTAALTKSQPTPFDVYNYLWKSYELELSHFWQRAIFLTVFLVGIASAYGIYIKDIFIPAFSQMIGKNGKDCIPPNYLTIGIIPIFLCILGLIFSYLWIAMMKGSKAWYELYEDSIAKVSGYDDFTGSYDNRFWNDSSFKKVFGEDSCPQQYRFGCMGYKETKGDNCIFSTERGPFSPSKINIIIGIISLCTFALLLLGHICCTLYYCQCKVLCVIFGAVCLFLELIFVTCCIIKDINNIKDKKEKWWIVKKIICPCSLLLVGFISGILCYSSCHFFEQINYIFACIISIIILIGGIFITCTYWIPKHITSSFLEEKIKE